MVELLFLPSVYTPCPTCHGARYNSKTLEIKYRDKNIAEVLRLTVDSAFDFFSEDDKDSPRRRLPPQSGQSLLTMYCDTRRFISALSEFANVLSI